MVSRLALIRFAPILSASRPVSSSISRTALRSVRTYASESQHTVCRVTQSVEKRTIFS